MYVLVIQPVLIVLALPGLSQCTGLLYNHHITISPVPTCHVYRTFSAQNRMFPSIEDTTSASCQRTQGTISTENCLLGGNGAGGPDAVTWVRRSQPGMSDRRPSAGVLSTFATSRGCKSPTDGASSTSSSTSCCTSSCCPEMLRNCISRHGVSEVWNAVLVFFVNDAIAVRLNRSTQ